MGCIYSADRGAHKQHLISIPFYYTMKVHTQCFSTFCLTCTVWDFVDPQHYIQLYLLTWIVLSSNLNLSFYESRIGCSIGVCRCSSDFAQVPSSTRLTVGIYLKRPTWCMTYYNVANFVTVTMINMRRQNALWLCNIHCCEIRAPSLPQTLRRYLSCSWSIAPSCSTVSVSHTFSCTSAHRFQELHNLTNLKAKSRNVVNAPI